MTRVLHIMLYIQLYITWHAQIFCDSCVIDNVVYNIIYNMASAKIQKVYETTKFHAKYRMKDEVPLLLLYTIATVLAFQYGRYKGHGTIFGRKTDRYYRIKEAEERL